MKELFVSKDFKADSLALIGRMNEFIESYQAQGYDLSLRQLYYRLVAAAVIPNTEQSYKRIGSILSDARLAGLVDWDAIVDRGRSLEINTHWESPGEIMRNVARGFRYDGWEEQPWHVEVMVEKQALEGVLWPVCRRLDIGFTANKGYSSSSAMYEAGQRIGGHLGAGKSVCVIYLGDHDPSGIDMTRDVEDRLKLFAEVVSEYGGVLEETGRYDGSLVVERIALNMDQVEHYNPPPNPTKVTDSRATGYIKRFGHTCWELDALEPAVLAELVTNMVGQYRDEDLWADHLARQQKARDVLTKLADRADKEAKS